MRKVTRYRLAFLLLAIGLYALGIQFTPDEFHPDENWPVFSGLFTLYFAVIPLLHLLLVVIGSKQKLWKILIPFSTSSLVCRYSMPAALASYFEFIAYLRYPIIAVLLIIELAIVYHVVRMLWQCRTMQGDPRASAIKKMGDEDEKKRTTAVLFAYEPATWYYLFPFLSRNHAPSLAHLRLASSSWITLVVLQIVLFVVTGALYSALALWSQLAAIIVGTLVGYTFIYLIANYRISKHHSAYVLDGHLVLNNNYLNLLVIPLTAISSIETDKVASPDEHALCLGNGSPNVKLTLSTPCCYYNLMATLTDYVEEVYLSVDTPEAFKTLQTQEQTTLYNAYY